MTRTLVTDDFDGGDRWLREDDLALLRFAVVRVVDRAVRAASEITQAPVVADFGCAPSPAVTEEPAGMTLLHVRGTWMFWLRNDVGGDANAPRPSTGHRWRRVGDEGWYCWRDVLAAASGRDLVRVDYGVPR